METPQQTKKNMYKKKLASINIPSLTKAPQVKIPQRQSKKSPAPLPRRAMIGSELSFGSLHFNPSPNHIGDLSSDRGRPDNFLNVLRGSQKMSAFENSMKKPSFPTNPIIHNPNEMSSYTKLMTSFGEYPSFQVEGPSPISFGNLLNIQSSDQKEKTDFSMLTSIKQPMFTPGTGLAQSLKFSFQNRDNIDNRMFQDALSHMQDNLGNVVPVSDFGGKLSASLKEAATGGPGESFRDKDPKPMFVSNIVHNQNIYINQNSKTGGSLVSSNKLGGINVRSSLKRPKFYNEALVTSSLTPASEHFQLEGRVKPKVSQFISSTKTSNLDKRSHMVFQSQAIAKTDLIDGPNAIIIPKRISKMMPSLRRVIVPKGRMMSQRSGMLDSVEPELKLEVRVCLAKPSNTALKFFLSEFRKFERNLEKREIYIQRAHYVSKSGKTYIVNPDMEKITSAGFSLTSGAQVKSVIDRTNSLQPTVFDQDFYDTTLRDEEGCQDIIRNTFLFREREKQPVLYRKIVTAILSLRADIFDNLKGLKSLSGAEHFMKYFNLQVPIKQQYFSSLPLKDRAKLMCFFFCKFFNRNKLLGLFGQFWPEIKIHHEYKTHKKMWGFVEKWMWLEGILVGE